VHEAYLKLVDQPGINWSAPTGAGRTRNQFFALASRAMRSILVDHARAKHALKRGGDGQRLPLEQADRTPTHLDDLTVLAIDDAMNRLAVLDPRKARLVEMRFFGGLSADEAADVLGIARSTAAEEWRMARAWLYQQLEDGS
jgi:RNA polymerase sigma factor (TIGR02999 family)